MMLKIEIGNVALHCPKRKNTRANGPIRTYCGMDILHTRELIGVMAPWWDVRFLQMDWRAMMLLSYKSSKAKRAENSPSILKLRVFTDTMIFRLYIHSCFSVVKSYLERMEPAMQVQKKTDKKETDLNLRFSSYTLCVSRWLLGYIYALSRVQSDTTSPKRYIQSINYGDTTTSYQPFWR